MRIARLFGVVLTILTAVLLLASPVAAQPPAKLTDHVTDNTGVLTDSARAAVNSAIDRLYHDRHLQLWVVYVDNFSRFKPENWAERTRGATGMGEGDALLAVATNTKLYAFAVPPNAAGLTAEELNTLQRKQIEPAVGARDWSGAAVAAAEGLNKPATSSKRNWAPVAIGVAVALGVLVLVVVLYRRRRRRRVGSQSRDNIGGGGPSLPGALSAAEARVRQISDYAGKHRQHVGAQAQALLEDAKRHLAAAHGRQTTNEREAIAYANRASTLAAQAQETANADVRAAHTPGPRRSASTR